MDTEQENRRRGLQAIALDVWENPGGEPAKLSLVQENMLWDYAAGLLDPAAEEQVWTLLARHPLAEPTLSRIRSDMARAGVPVLPAADEVAAPTSALDRACARVRAALAAAGRDVSSLVAVIVQVGEGLVSVMEDTLAGPPRPAVAPLLLDGQGPATADPTAARPRLDFPAAPGVHLAVIRRPQGTLDLDLEVTQPPLDGEVRVASLTVAGRVSETLVAGRLRHGRVTLADCPAGLLQVSLPGERTLTLCVEHAETGESGTADH